VIVTQKDGVVVIQTERTGYRVDTEEMTVHEAERAIKGIRKAIDEIRAEGARRTRNRLGEH